jgi:hypothetical protein
MRRLAAARSSAMSVLVPEISPRSICSWRNQL